ncbi:hypothetical protein [Rheinheimera sp. NSM]|uniref:hypothetical protein n=1 Tax=Rheinheimera sp. NSM TaxID=3457884 RepID=UPI00403671CE
MSADVCYFSVKPLIRLFLLGSLLVPVAFVSAKLQASEFCDLNLASRVGPRDYFDQQHHKAGRIGIVERIHLTPEMLRLEKGNTASISDDLNYTLTVIPNHPAALDLASRLDRAIRDYPDRYRRETMKRTVDCYFQRAFRYTPSQPYLHYIFAIHLHRNQIYEKAADAYTQAQRLGLNNAELAYNFGLTLFELKRYDEARKMADNAKALNYPFDALQQKLAQKGF